MAITYITWIAHKVSHNTISHIKPVMDYNWSDVITCEERGLGRVASDPRELGTLEGDMAVLNEVQAEGDTILDRIKSTCGNFYIHTCTAQEALDYCNTWYPVAPEDVTAFPDGYFELDIDLFTIIDNRPIPEDI